MNPALAGAQKVFDDLRASLSDRIGRDIVVSDRLKILIAVVAGVVILSSLLGMHQLVGSLERRYAKAQVDMVRLRSQIETNVWEGRKQDSQALKSVLEGRLWSAATPGLATANFESWIRAHLGPYKMDPLQPIQISRVPLAKQASANGASDPLANVERMTAKLIVPFNDPANMASFLADVAQSEKAIVLNRFRVTAGRNARAEIDISTFYRTSGPGS